MPDVRHDPDKWKKRTSAAATDYQKGVTKPRKAWHTAVAEAKDAYEQGVQAAIADNRYGNAATAENGAKQMRKAASIGAQRFSPGVQASGDAYDKGVKPYIEEIRRTELPPRGRKGDPANYDRSIAMGTALHEKKKEMKGR